MSNKKIILIVEDDTYIRELYEEVLQEAGFSVETAVDGEEGLVKIQAGGFDLILLDIMMPKLDGLGVLKAMKGKKPKKANGPTVLLTNLGHDPIIKEGIELGAKAYLIKSDITPDKLVEKAKAYIKG